MPYKYNPPTRTHCPVCEELVKNKQKPIISSENGKASSASKFPFHNWYYFVLGYTPEFPDYILAREKADSSFFVVDPFMGTGTTLLCCKAQGVPCAGIDANDYFFDVAQTKADWSVDVEQLKKERDKILALVSKEYLKINFENTDDLQMSLFSSNGHISATDYATKYRPEMLTARYLSDKPFVRAHIIKKIIDKQIAPGKIKRLFDLAISSIIVPISNVRYGPGFGVAKAKDDVDVFGVFKEKIDRIISDLHTVTEQQKKSSTDIRLGDARLIADYFQPNSVDLMITSPPYPGDHEYTKHTRLELIFMGYAQNLSEFRKIKKRMIRGSTTNIYKDDNDRKYVEKFESIHKVTNLIDERLKADGATSGFEKLYTKLVWEYFGGMYRVLLGAHKLLKTGGKFCLLVSDSHAFKMVHIQTAPILAEIGKDIGYSETIIDLWQDKISTSHNYHIREDILTLVK